MSLGYVPLRAGDSSDWLGRDIVINISSSLDLTGWSAKFKLQEVTKDFHDISSKQISIALTKEDTYNLVKGFHYGYLKIYDNVGRAGTVLRIRFRVDPAEVPNGI